MNPGLWASLHGASTHFPIALTVMAAGCELAGTFRWERPGSAGWRAAGALAVTLAAAGSVAAAISGLVMTHGDLLGRGTMRLHHLAVWPVIGLLVGAAAWRGCLRATPSRTVHARYAGFLMFIAVLSFVAGYTGGELLHDFP